jgi:hypothetical protein
LLAAARTCTLDETQSTTFQMSGQAAAAGQNRQREARLGILKALQALGIPVKQWPDFVQVYYRESPQPMSARQLISPPPFQAPPFDRLNESPKEWKKKADEKWEQHCELFLKDREFWVKQGVDEKIAETKRRRGTGKAQSPRKRKNTAIECRYEWAALRVCGEAWKEIAARYECRESAVTKAASKVLRVAHWPTKPKSQT